ncbi:MAG: EscR/YscR/HrcR family type III secretion system export apparatus protein [Myxococcales bacterium]|nr:EscR/YscR/HrcR family type III secretion system export apparatus protein [Myxococcales bacterium]
MAAELPALTTWVALTVAPLLAITCTSFTKISVVMSALRVGLGAEVLLPWSAVFALSLVLTAVVMGPAAAASYAALAEVGGIESLSRGPGSALTTVLEPLQGFLQRHADGGELEFFAGLQGVAPDHPLALVPAFLITELGEALQVSLLILVPFLLVDLVLAQVLVLMGINHSQPQALVGLPLKISLFLAVGGWEIVVRGLLEGYA